MSNFRAIPQGTVSIAVTAASQDLTISPGKGDLMLTNIGTQTIFFKYDSGGASVSTDTPLLANSQAVFSIPPGVATIAVIAGAVGSTLYATPGNGE